MMYHTERHHDLHLVPVPLAVGNKQAIDYKRSLKTPLKMRYHAILSEKSIYIYYERKQHCE